MKKVLIANRGEIALRVQRACDKLGLLSAITVSDVDGSSYFAKNAHELAPLGGSAANESYLAIDKILAAAKNHNCDAVHPGYGFLSENADFAAAVVAAGLVFVGPRPEVIKTLGSKTGARAAAAARGVPMLPGTAGDLTDAQLLAEADKIGYPVILKAVSGGGGRGMRISESRSLLAENIPLARGEAKKFFSDPQVYIERYVAAPRHIEVQLMGDNHGNLIHVGTRECSAQRRHQKIIEEAPAANLSPALREQIHQAALAAGHAVRYNNAGTVEFILDGNRFYFMEVNTRIQVEHPVSEVVSGLDLVALQLKVAMGEKLPIKQEDVVIQGQALEFRIYGEDPGNNFAPSIGKIEDLTRLTAPWLREDFGFDVGDTISTYYDAMVSKIIVWGPTREAAIERSKRALAHYKLTGFQTTTPAHNWLLYNNDFVNSNLHVRYIEKHYGEKEHAFGLAQVAPSRLDDSKLCEVTKYIKIQDGIPKEVAIFQAPTGEWIKKTPGESSIASYDKAQVLQESY